jgi:CO/xanthine dehydrogenase FAD-binding subunit
VTIQTSEKTASERVTRTPADKPIVAILGRQTESGMMFAACGLADKPIVLAEVDLADLRPPADFRGSAAYRLEMAKVLLGRVRHRMESGA